MEMLGLEKVPKISGKDLEKVWKFISDCQRALFQKLLNVGSN